MSISLTPTSPLYVTLQNAAAATGNGTQLDVSSYSALSVIATFTGTATVTFEASVDGTTWDAISGYGVVSGFVNIQANNVSSNNRLRFYVGGYGYFRARVSAWTSGTVTVAAEATSASAIFLPPTINTNADAGATGYHPLTASYLYGYNGTSYDRLKTVTGLADNNSGTGLMGSGQYIYSSGPGLWVRIKDMNGLNATAASQVGIPATGLMALGSTGLDKLSTTANAADTSSAGILAIGGYGYNGSTWDRLRSVNTGQLVVTLKNSSGTEPSISAGFGDGISSTTNALATGAFNSGYNGSTWDRLRTAAGAADGTTLGLLAEGRYGWNGAGWDRQRVNNIHKYQEYLSLAAGTTYAWWTPTAGKKFRLMSVLMGSSTATMLTLKDGANNIATFNVGGRDTKDFQFGNNGYLSSAANNVLNVYNNSASTITFWLTVVGTEE